MRIRTPWDEPIKPCTTPAEMRAEIHRLSYTGNLVRQIIDTANMQGLSSEDKYTLLAYHALQEMRRAQEAVLTQLYAMPASFLAPHKNGAGDA